MLKKVLRGQQVDRQRMEELKKQAQAAKESERHLRIKKKREEKVLEAELQALRDGYAFIVGNNDVPAAVRDKFLAIVKRKMTPR